MNYDEYVREGHLRYEEFARTVAAILRTAIDDSGQDFHLQQISFRAKSKSSLHRKLAERARPESQSIEIELKESGVESSRQSNALRITISASGSKLAAPFRRCCRKPSQR